MPSQARRSSEHDLVSFEHPPVVEVALSAQFPPETVDEEALGLFAHQVREQLPTRQRQPVVPAMEETFGVVPALPTFEIHLDMPANLPRTWFLSSDETYLVQLQHDRLTLNWRELQPAVEYPRYDQLRDTFQQYLARLVTALRKVANAPPANLVEVTYVNMVDTGRADAQSHPDLAEIVNRVRRRPDDAFLPEAEDASLQARWRIPAAEMKREGSPAGRLYLHASPGFRPPAITPTYLLNLSARVIPTQGDVDGVMAALDVGHRWVVLGFKDLTAPELHHQWGLQEER